MTIPPGATYRALTDAAARHAAAATLDVAQAPLSSPICAREALASDRGLLAAIRRHARVLLGAHRLAAAGFSPDPADAPAARLFDVLGPFAHSRTPGHPMVTGAGVEWAAGATTLGAAGDLLATHHDRDRVVRTPEALLIEEPEPRGAGLTGLGVLARTVLITAPHLGLRAGQAGIPWPEVNRLLPELTSATTCAHALAALAGPAGRRWNDSPSPARRARRRPAHRAGRPAAAATQLRVAAHPRPARRNRHPVRLRRSAVIFQTHANRHRPAPARSAGQTGITPENHRTSDARTRWAQIHHQTRDCARPPPPSPSCASTRTPSATCAGR